MKLQVTDKAFVRISELVDSKTAKILRISVNSGGCSGYVYKYEFIDEIEDDDLIISRDSTKVAVDPISMEFLNGSVVDFVEELGAAYFQISNPKAKSKCGCGNSFSE